MVVCYIKGLLFLTKHDVEQDNVYPTDLQLIYTVHTCISSLTCLLILDEINVYQYIAICSWEINDTSTF